jgi:antitoxin component YwqK of YwqJK toxin-antitoxin module
MNSFYTTGKMKSTGHYVRNYKDGDWKFFDERGKLIRTVIYKMGKTDDKEWEERDNTELLNLEKNRSKLKDPEKYRNDPSGYMRNGGGAFDGGE